MTSYSSHASSPMYNRALSTIFTCYRIERLKRHLSKDARFVSGSRLMRVAAAILGILSPIAVSQAQQRPNAEIASSGQPSLESICSVRTQDSAKNALRQVCQERPLVSEQTPASQTIVIGFVGGFANPRDVKHPEVLFAAFLRQHYASGVHARVFSNHDRNGALRYVMGLLDTNRDGSLSNEERKSARIIIYGHSWGASETVAFAAILERYDIPVLLTVQLDTVGKWGQQPSRIPSNVESAVNFYQSEGFLRGRPQIVAANTAQTEVVGNFRYTYVDKPINCDNYPWFARTFNKPHHEIENDADVWRQIALLIDSKISGGSRADHPLTTTATRDDEFVGPATAQPGLLIP